MPSINSNLSTRSPKDTFLRRNTRFESSSMKIGWSVRAVREPKKKRKKGYKRCIARVRGGVTPIGGMMKLGTLVQRLDVMNHAEFHFHHMIILGASVGQKRGFALEMHKALTTLRCASALASQKEFRNVGKLLFLSLSTTCIY
jgi:hypothetical protein